MLYQLIASQPSNSFGHLTATSRPGFAMSFGYYFHCRQLTETRPMGTLTRMFRENGLRNG